jgi:hypothetical protein
VDGVAAADDVRAHASFHASYPERPTDVVTPEFEGKLECINYMCARIKLHTRNDLVNTDKVPKCKREY